MSDGSFREIQLTAKQVVFLFMAGLVAAVGIFLLGVQVGQRVSPDVAPPDSVTARDTEPPATMPPPTTLKPDEMTAPNELQGRPQPAVTAPPAETPAPPPASTPTPTPTPTPETTRTTETKAANQKPAPTPTPAGTHWVQAGAFASRANAERLLGQLKAKGFAFQMLPPAGRERTYRLRSALMTEADARALRARLTKEGFTSSLIPR